MQIEERCKTRIPGRPGEGAVRGVFLVQPREASSWSRGVPALHSPGSGCSQNKWRAYIRGWPPEREPSAGLFFFFFFFCGKNVVYAPPLDELEKPNRPKLTYEIGDRF